MNSDTDLGQIVGDRYLLLDSIGQGAMADVHLARDQRDGQLVALKWLAPNRRTDTAYQARLRQEAELLAQVHHPNVVQLIDHGETGQDGPYLILEALVGETLHEYLGRNGAMSVQLALPLIMQFGLALDAVHRAGLVHGDVKPHNVFLCGKLDNPDSVKLIDFGFARSSNGTSTTDGDTVAGTLEYMAPEQILSDPIDARADIYSFGIVLFRWLTAELPFDSGPILGLFAHHLASTAPPPSWLIEGLPPGLEKVILAAMRKNPANRYASMADLLADLNCVISGQGEVRGAPIVQEPDEYCPSSEQGQRACRILIRTGLSVKPPAEPSERPVSVTAEL